MDLIYADKDRNDLGVLINSEVDFEISNKADECTFEIKVPMENNPIQKGYLVYIEGTEFGGIVDQMTINTAKKETKLNGRTFRGVLGSKILIPDEDYYILNGNLATALNQALIDTEMNSFYEVVANPDAPSVTNFKAYRYGDLYSTLMRVLFSTNHKAFISYSPARKKVLIELKPIGEYTNKTAITSDFFDFELTSSTPVNHIIGLGAGQLSERYVVHRYLQVDGSIGTIRYYTGLEEIVATYEDANLSNEELEQKITEKLKELSQGGTFKITSNDLNADLGDMFTAEDLYTEISVTQYVTNKIVTINDRDTKKQYKVGNKL